MLQGNQFQFNNISPMAEIERRASFGSEQGSAALIEVLRGLREEVITIVEVCVLGIQCFS